jgi:hypothetical protein
VCSAKSRLRRLTIGREKRIRARPAAFISLRNSQALNSGNLHSGSIPNWGIDIPDSPGSFLVIFTNGEMTLDLGDAVDDAA